MVQRAYFDREQLSLEVLAACFNNSIKILLRQPYFLIDHDVYDAAGVAVGEFV